MRFIIIFCSVNLQNIYTHINAIRLIVGCNNRPMHINHYANIYKHIYKRTDTNYEDKIKYPVNNNKSLLKSSVKGTLNKL